MMSLKLIISVCMNNLFYSFYSCLYEFIHTNEYKYSFMFVWITNNYCTENYKCQW